MYSIPNFANLYREVVDYVKAHQGEKGYIDCQPFRIKDGEVKQDFSKDIIYGFAYDEEHRAGMEEYVYGVRVCLADDDEGNHSEDDLEVILEPIMSSCRTLYQPEDFKDEDAWLSVRWNDTLYYIPTLLNIAESIEQYGE